MARQKSIIKLEGTIGDISFYKSKDGYIAREKTSITAERIATDPKFARTRENGAEFGRAGKASKLIRTAFQPLLTSTKDARMVSRLTTLLVKVLRGDTINGRGLRTVQDGMLDLLLDFDFNINGKLGTFFFVEYTSTINRVAGELEVALPAFIPVDAITAPPGTTHYKILSGGAELDFENQLSVRQMQSTNILPWNEVASAPMTLTSALTPNSTLPMLQVLGVEFYQEVNGTMYSLKNGSGNALNIVNIDL